MTLSGELFTAIIAVVSAAVTSGVAYGVLKVKTASTAQRLNELEAEAIAIDARMTSRVDHISNDLASYKQDTADRLARIETKLDLLLQKQIVG